MSVLNEKITFLRYVVKNSSIKPSTEKTIAIGNFAVPNYFESHFRRLVSNYAIIAKSLSDMLHKNITFKIDDEVLAFQELKHRIVGTPVVNQSLSLYNINALIEILTDASI